MTAEKAGASSVAIINTATATGSLDFAHTAYVVNLGTVANAAWQTGAIATAATAMITGTLASGTAMDFVAQDTNGSSYIWEAKGGLDAAHLTKIVTLVGIAANTLTVHDFDEKVSL